MPSVPQRIVVEASGALLVAGPSSIVRVNRDTGNRSLVSGIHPVTQQRQGNGPLFNTLTDIKVGIDGSLFVIDSEFQAVFRVDAQTGDRSIISR